MHNPYSHLEDNELMELYKNGEYMAFEVIYLRHKDKVYTYLNKRLHDKGLTEDLFQSIFIKFHKCRHLYNKKYSLLQWIYTISRSELLDYFKKNKNDVVPFDESYITIEQEFTDNTIDLSSFKELSEKEKSALELRFNFDKDFSEISELLNTSEINSRKIVSRAIRKLRSKLLGEKL